MCVSNTTAIESVTYSLVPLTKHRLSGSQFPADSVCLMSCD